MKRLLCIAVISVLASCNSNEPTETEIFKIKELGELATSEYTLSKVLELNDEGEFYKFGNRKILVSCQARVKVGINLNQLAISDIDYSGKSIKIGLPSTRLLSFEMVPESIKTELVDVSGFRSNFTQEDKNRILKQGENNLRNNLVSTGIFTDGYKNAAAFVDKFYRDLGFTKIEIYAQKARI